MRIHKENGEIITMTLEESEKLAQETITKSKTFFITNWIDTYIDIRHQWIFPAFMILAIITIAFPKPATKVIEVLDRQEVITFQDGNWHFLQK